MVYDLCRIPPVINLTNDRVLPLMFSVISPTARPVVGISTRFPLVAFLPGIAYLSRSVYNEFVPSVLRRVRLDITSAPDVAYLENFLDSLPIENGWEKVLNLALLDMVDITRSPGRASEVMDMVTRASALQVIVLNFKLQDLYLPPGWPDLPRCSEEAAAYTRNPVRIANARYLLNECMVYRLLNLSKLQRVVFIIHHGHFAHTPHSIGILSDLGDLLKGAFENVPGVPSVYREDMEIRGPNMSVVALIIRRG